MKIRKSLGVFGLIFWSALSAYGAFQLPAVPHTRINDYSNTLSAREQALLERQYARFEEKTGHQALVAIFPTLDDESIDDVANKLFSKWGIGSRKNNDGILLVLNIEKHGIKIEVGYGLEPVLTDALSAHILREDLAPYLREGRYAAALSAYERRLEDVFSGDYRAAPEQPHAKASAVFFWVLVIFALPLILFPGVLAHRDKRGRLLNSRGSRWVSGGGWWWWGGGGGWGGGSGGGWGGGGGWSGGGGSSGGGGASGSW